MRYATEHKQLTRTRVLQAAAKAIRIDGPHRIGVAGVMADAGLTHGGFYAHFSSKDDLVAATIGYMFERAEARFLRETEGRDPARGVAAYIDFYLSRLHRDARDFGCPMVALASDVPRLHELARERFSSGTDKIVIMLSRKLAALGLTEAEALANSVMAELVGALLLARIEPNARRSDAVLIASRCRIKARLGLDTGASADVAEEAGSRLAQ